MKEKATEQQMLFVEEYLKLKKSNQKQAAINAGYSPKSAESQACQLLKNPKVDAYLKKREKILADELRSIFVFDAIEARNIMASIMLNPNTPAKDRITCAKDFLDRAGFKPMDKVEHSGEISMPIIKIEK